MMRDTMRRWNGWGEESTIYPLPAGALAFLRDSVGAARPPTDATLANVVASVPESRLPEHPLVSHDPADRLRHARGQSLPDWIALRSGRIGRFPDGVAYPASGEEVQALIRFAGQVGAKIIPYGGGTSVVGHVNPPPGEGPVLTADLARFNQMLELDETARLATFGAGISGPELERQLNSRSFTLGHFPQSHEYSTLGGWIATRSSGQQSYHYGRIEDLFAGGRVEAPAGCLELPSLPASAAGPDLRQLVLGSEGRLGIITQATVRLRPLPETEGFYAIFFPDWPSGAGAVREIVQAGTPASMLRLSDAQETETTLALAGNERLVSWADRALRLFQYGAERCLLIYGVTGDRQVTSLARRRVKSIARARGGLPVGSMIGRQWRKGRFGAPYLRNTLWEHGYAIDTLETAVNWPAVLPAAAAIKEALSSALSEMGQRVLVFAHLSHVYQDGASIYVTYLFPLADDPEDSLRRWQLLKGAASQAVVAQGGTISHQHGVGRDHAPYLEAEKGAEGIRWLEAVRQAADPDRLMNPGKLLLD